MAWVDFPALGLSSSLPLHAGVTMDWWRSNTKWAVDEGGYDFQSLAHDGDLDYSYTPAAINTWYLFDTFNQMPLPVRRDWSGVWNSLNVGFAGKTSAAGNATIRVYLRGEFSRPSGIVVDGTDGLEGETAYGEFVYNNSLAWEYKEDNIAPEWVGEMPSPLDDFGFPDRHPAVWLLVLVKVSAAITIELRGPRVWET